MLTMHDIVCADGVSVEDVTEEKKCGSKGCLRMRKSVSVWWLVRGCALHSHSVV